MAASPQTDAPVRSESTQTAASPLDAHASPVRDRGRKNGMATAALVLGIIGIPVGIAIAFIGVVLGILATVFGATARGQIRRSAQTNLGQASWGMYLGILAIVVAVVNIVAAVIIHTS